MAITVHTDVKVYQAEAQVGFVETLTQQADAFNAASNGAIVMSQKIHEGYFDSEAGWKVNPGMVTRRDITANPATPVTDQALIQVEQAFVKLFRKIGPLAYTRGAFRTMMQDPGQGSVVVGRQMGQAVAIDMLNSGLRAAVAALAGTASAIHNVTAASPVDTISTDHLLQTMFKAGDSAQGIVVWVMHSVAYSKLVRDQSTTFSFDSVAGVNVATGTPVTFGRPVLLTDAPPLYSGTSPTDPVRVLGLRRGAIEIRESELQDVVTDDITGGEQLAIRVQGELAYSVGVMGYTYDKTTAGAAAINPLDAALATTSNWDQFATSHKSVAGVMLVADAQ